MSEIIQDSNNIRHPSLTVAFIFKVSLCFPFVFTCFKEITAHPLVRNNSTEFYPSCGIRLFVKLSGGCPKTTLRHSRRCYGSVTRSPSTLLPKAWTWWTLWTGYLSVTAWRYLCRSPKPFLRKLGKRRWLNTSRLCASEVSGLQYNSDVTECHPVSF